MAKEKIDLREDLAAYKAKFKLYQEIPCTKEENKTYTQLCKDGKPLPENVYKYEYVTGADYEDFYTVYIPDLTEQEVKEYLTFKKLDILNTIKNCVLFFTVLTIIGLTAWLLIFMRA